MANSTLERLLPTASTSVALLFVGTITGFFLGRATTSQSILPARTGPIQLQESDQSESDYDSDIDTDLTQPSTDSNEECKLILVVRTDLGMTKGIVANSLFMDVQLLTANRGKIAAQCGHATLACYKAHLKQNSKVLKQWESTGQAKIAVQIKSEDDMLMLQAKAISLGLCAKVIHDAGRTQIASGSATVLGVGPGPKSLVDQVTGGLKLL
jgi:PTH2 family peptidyl-tRNA hydrolase